MADDQKSDTNSKQPAVDGMARSPISSSQSDMGSAADIASRKRTEEETRSNEELFSAAFQSGPLLMTISDIDTGRYLQVNDNFVKVSGYSREDAIGKTSVELGWISAEDRDHLIQELNTQRRVTGMELRLKRKTGETIWCLFFGEVITIFGGKRLMSIAEDISERKQAEAEVRMLKHSIDVQFDGAYWIDTDNIFVYVNDAACKALGYKREELIGKTIDVVSPKANNTLMKEVWARLRQGGSYSVESVHRRKDGSDFPVEVVTTYVRFGGREYICGFARDITERRKAADNLIHSHNLMQYIISHAQSAIAVHDRDLKYVYVSEQYLRQYKVKEQDVIGKHHYEVFPDLPQKWRDVHQRVLAGAVESSEEDPYVREDGSVDWTRWECRPWYESDGSIGGLIVYTEVITERKEMEKLLQQQRTQLEEAQRISHVGSWERDISTNAVTWSDELMHIFGINTREQKPTFQLLLDMMHPDDREPFQKAVRDAVFEKKPYSIEYRVVLRDGSTRFIHARGEAQYDASGKPSIFRGTAQDITERKNAEVALRESEQKFRNLAEESPNMIFINKKGRVVFANKRCEDITGYSRAEFYSAGFDFLGLIAPEHRDRVKKYFQRHQSGENIPSYEYALIAKSGKRIETLIATKLIDFEGEQAILGIVTDITERKRAEEALRKDEEFIRTILNTVDEAFIVIDRDYRIVTANNAYRVSASRDDLIGKYCYEISHGSDVPCFNAGEDCAVRMVFETGRPQVSVHTHQDKDGRLIHVETKAFPLKDSSGNVFSAIETINNITEKHLLEEERLKTQKLEAVGTLAGGIAHDFNNLLQGVFGYISLAKLTMDQKEKSVAALEQAEKALHLSVNLTSQLLTFSKGGKPVRQRFDLRPVIENAAKFALSGSRSDCILDIGDGLWAADADSGQIGQVIQNIVLNADQAMPEGGHVEISAHNVEAPNDDLPQGLKNGRYVKISIKDNGIGIPEQYLAKIFDPYFTTKEKGSGLGLATSYSIVRNHGGLIDVRSQPGKGTTFVVYIPTAAPRSKTPADAVVPRPAHNGRILVMDDDEVVRTVAGELIRALGHEVDFAEHGEGAVSKFKTARESDRPFDIVILDLTVRGGMGGLETVQKLREIDPDVKAIVSSGYSDNSATAEYQKSGFRSFLKKPYNIEELRNTLNALLT